MLHKKNTLILLVAILLAMGIWSTFGEEPKPVTVELQELIGQINQKLMVGKQTEADLSTNINQFDVILAKHKDEKTDEVAEVLYQKAVLYLMVLGNQAKGTAILQTLKQDFPDSKIVIMLKRQEAEALKRQDEILKRQDEAQKQIGLTLGAKFPDFQEKDSTGKPLSIGSFKGKVVLVDFWATWCGPCVLEMPSIVKAFDKYHTNGLEIVGINLDMSRDQLEAFVKKNSIPWSQYFDGQAWESKLVRKYGVSVLPANFLLDREGNLIAKNLHGADLDTTIARAVMQVPQK